MTTAPARPATVAQYLHSLERHRAAFAHLDVGRGCIRMRSFTELPRVAACRVPCEAAREAAAGGPPSGRKGAPPVGGIRVGVALVALAALAAAPSEADGRCPRNRSRQGAMWLSIAHPGLGEYYLKGWGPWSRMPPKKFWLGFIPLYGWPGYLQVKSADDAFHCRTNDELSYPPEPER